MPEFVPTQANPIFHETTEGGIRYSPASAHSKEMAKWETRPLPDGSVTQSMIDAARRAGVHQGSFEHQEYPKAMVRFEQTPNGIKFAESRSVQNDTEEANLLSRGFRMKADEAIQVVEDANQDAAVFAANRAFSDRRMTPKAQEEADAMDSSVARHLGEIPAQRLPPQRHRRTKAQMAADAAKG